MAASSEGATVSSALLGAGGQKARRGEESRDWSALPELTLFSICSSLTGSLSDVLAFRRVCRAWRSVAEATERDLVSSLPPLLFRGPDGDFYCPADGQLYRNRRLEALLGAGGAVEVVGCSFDHLIFFHSSTNTSSAAFFVVKPLTGTVACQFPPNYRAIAKWAVLSSPPASPDCVLWSSNGFFTEFCRPGDEKWTLCSFKRRNCIPQPVFLGGKGYVLYQSKLGAFDIKSCSKLAILQSGVSPSSARSAESRLCVVDAELLQISVLRYRDPPRSIRRFLVYRFDFSMALWVELASLGDRALFWDRFNATIWDNPRRWGGCGNCIYFVDFPCDTLGVFQLWDGKIEHLATGSPSNPMFCLQSPVWILPSMCY